MSSDEDDYKVEDANGSGRGAKKRRVQRACDVCRRKKIRCDGNKMKNNRCSGCVAFGMDCTYVETATKRATSNAYVKDLEAKLDRTKKLENLIRQLCPDDLTFNALMSTVDGPSGSDSMKEESSPASAGTPTANTENDHVPTILDSIATAIRDGPSTSVVEDEDDKIAFILSERVNNIHIDQFKDRFLGKSSSALLLQRAIEARNTYNRMDLKNVNSVNSNFRPELWSLRRWEKVPHVIPHGTPFDFPDHDLLSQLIELYFKRIDLYLPVLHRPSFIKSCEDGLHLKDTSFALVVLLVCAIAARYTDDPRTRLEQEDHRSAGWKWFKQALDVQKTFLSPHTLSDLQFYPLAVEFLSSSTIPQSCWTLLGIGLRVAQDMGIHRRGLPKLPTPEAEMRKRCFWVMLVLERIYGSTIGRPCAIHDEDIDLEFPIECDDEYWDHDDPGLRFVQPQGKPSKVTAFIWMIKLTRIMVVTLRTIYAINKSKVLFGLVGDEWEPTIIAELDSCLNVWKGSLPEHLRWDPERDADDFTNQSLALYATYYYAQIIIHRPFIPTPSRPSRLPFPSLAICTSAARSCSHLVDLTKPGGDLPALLIRGPLITSALILLLSLFSHKRSAHSQDMIEKDLKDVRSCLAVLQACEKLCYLSACLGDVLRYLTETLSPPPDASRKRQRGYDPSIHTSWTHTSTSNDIPVQNGYHASTVEARREPAPMHNDFGPAFLRAFLFDPADPVSSNPGPSSTTDVEATAPDSRLSASSNLHTVHPSVPQLSADDFERFWSQPESLTGTSMQSSQSTFTVDPSLMSSIMFNMEEQAVLPPDMNAFNFGGIQPGSSSSSMGEGIFTSPASLAGVDPSMIPTQHGFPAALNIGMDSEAMNMNVWSDSPAGMLFQEFAPFFAQLDGATQPTQQQQQPTDSVQHF